MPSLLMSMTPLECGLLSGLIHHFALQYPTQANVFTTLFAFMLSNVLYTVSWMIYGDHEGPSSSPIGRMLGDLLVFNATYVGAL